MITVLHELRSMILSSLIFLPIIFAISKLCALHKMYLKLIKRQEKTNDEFVFPEVFAAE
jgi:hypothetical protein